MAAIAQQAVNQEIRTAVRHSAVYGVGSMVVKGLGFLMLPFYTHHLTPADYGILEILDLSMSLFGMFLNMGLAAGFLRYYSAAVSEQDRRRTVSTAFLFVAGTATAALLMFFPLIVPASRILLGDGVSSGLLLMSFGSLIASYAATPGRTYLRAMEASGILVTIETVAVAVLLLLNVFFIAVLGLGLRGILLSSLLVTGTQALLLSVWVVRRTGWHFDSLLLRRMVAFGLPLILSNLAAFILNFSDRYFLQRFQSLDAVGVYAVGYKFGFMLNYLLMQPFCAMWEPRRYIIYSRPDHRVIYAQIFSLYGALLIYGWLALALLSPEIVLLMVGPDFAASQEVIPLIALSYVFWGLGYHSQLGMLLANRTRLIGGISASATILNLGLNYVLVLRYGALGAAWATALSFAAIAVASYWCSQSVLRLPLAAGRMMAGMIVATALWLFARQFTPAPLIQMLLMKTALLLAFPLLLWKTRIVSPLEVETVFSSLRQAATALSRFSRRREETASGA